HATVGTHHPVRLDDSAPYGPATPDRSVLKVDQKAPVPMFEGDGKVVDRPSPPLAVRHEDLPLDVQTVRAGPNLDLAGQPALQAEVGRAHPEQGARGCGPVGCNRQAPRTVQTDDSVDVKDAVGRLKPPTAEAK